MTDKENRRLTVITNTELAERTRIKEADNIPPNINGYQTNPMYEKLLNFKEVQKKKRFTVDDLLKW